MLILKVGGNSGSEKEPLGDWRREAFWLKDAIDRRYMRKHRVSGESEEA